MAGNGISTNFGRPGIGAALSAQRLNVSRDGVLTYFPAGGTIEGTKARDTTNTTSVLSLQAGLPMGKITTGGLWANSIIGVTTAAYTSGGTSLTVGAATATELVRRVGASGTFKLVAPATAGGTNVTATVTYSAASGTTITISDIGANKISGGFIVPSDGSETILSFIPDGYNLVIPDDGAADINFPLIPVAGILDSSNLIFWPSDTTLRTYIRDSLSTASGGKFVFSDKYTATS